MQKTSPVQMRKMLELVNALKESGILFVPMPVLDEADAMALVTQMTARLEQLAVEAESQQTMGVTVKS